MNIAVLSDIHGNSRALKTVFDDLESKNVDIIFNLGDSLYGPLDPQGTFELLKSKNIVSISGNQDRYIIENLNNSIDNETLKYVLSELDNDAIIWLKSLSFDYRHENDIYFFHGTPKKDDEYLLEELFPTHIGVKITEKLDELLKDIKEKIVLCGHSHVPRITETSEKKIINPGSVGLQAYDDDLPIFHKMENFHNHACYCILQIGSNKVKIEQITVPYDFESAAKMAEINNRPDWAKWIRTGRA